VVIVGGSFEVDPGQRDAFLTERHEVMRTSRAEPGCLEYTFSADPLDPGRVVLFERWESQRALDDHLVRLRAAPAQDRAVAATKASILIYDVVAERPVG
jgi:quinol monooxygenase YgiN